MPGGAIMNTGHVRAAALAAAVIMMLAGCAAAHRDAGLAALTKPGDRNVTVAAIPSPTSQACTSRRMRGFSPGRGCT